MYNAQITKDRIIARAAELGISVRQVLLECGLNPNIVNQIKNKHGLSSYVLMTLAERLECSVDYLLGRSDWLNGEECLKICRKIAEGASLTSLVNDYGADIVTHYPEWVRMSELIAKEEGKPFAGVY